MHMTAKTTLTQPQFDEVKAKSEKKTDKVPTLFGPSYQGSYPEEMRTQLWPLCCGARIISGFKAAHNSTLEDLVEQIEAVLKAVPDHQVFHGEQMCPKLTFLTLNSGQMGSKKIMDAVTKCGFVKIAEAKPRGSVQGFFVRDDSKSWVSVVDPAAKGAVA
jgi:hypothetical protein